MFIMFSIAVVQTKIISCNSANTSCLLQVVHTKAFATVMQFCDFYPIEEKIVIEYSGLKLINCLQMHLSDDK